ncbi:MAG: glutamyl-tRNA reductase [Candidatus Poribacteria bacterium]|nr:glutamyl-tRNA reductase [Candidatus Poribacteria bacterium]
MNQIHSVGTSHHTAPLDFREKLAFSQTQILQAFPLLREQYHFQEAVILSTCNRVEVYAASEVAGGGAPLLDFLSAYHHIDSQTLKKFTYAHQDEDAVRHLFDVSASLDSMVVGEPQILGQVKDAYDTALAAGASGQTLNRLFSKAISVGKRVRTETNIASGAVSIGFAAVELAKKIFQSLKNKTVAIVGAGEMSELTAQHLVENGASKVIVANRTFERAVEIAEKFDGIPLPYDESLSFLVDADIVISSTDAPHYLIQRKPLAEVMRKRKNRHMFLIDIAVPRDIDPEVGKIENAFLYNIDDLDAVVASNIKDRQREAEIAGRIVEEEAIGFYSQLQLLKVTPTIKALNRQFQGVVERELQACIKKAELSPEQRAHVQSMTQAIVKKLLHQPVKNLRQKTNDIDGGRVRYIQALQELFALKDVENRTETED